MTTTLCGCGETFASEAAIRRHVNAGCTLAGMTGTADVLRIDCPTCNARDVAPAHVGRCQRTTDARTEAIDHGARHDVPRVTTDDLWAHLGHVASPEDATRIVRQVLDLGWRPVVGKDKARLWGAS